jgi:uncharacterized protein with PIN domain
MTFNSFQALGKEMGVKAPKEKKQEEVKKCPNCGNPLRKVRNSNVYLCDFSTLKDEKLNNKDVQVFTKCGFTLFE